MSYSPFSWAFSPPMTSFEYIVSLFLNYSSLSLLSIFLLVFLFLDPKSPILGCSRCPLQKSSPLPDGSQGMLFPLGSLFSPPLMLTDNQFPRVVLVLPSPILCLHTQLTNPPPACSPGLYPAILRRFSMFGGAPQSAQTPLSRPSTPSDSSPTSYPPPPCISLPLSATSTQRATQQAQSRPSGQTMWRSRGMHSSCLSSC